MIRLIVLFFWLLIAALFAMAAAAFGEPNAFSKNSSFSDTTSLFADKDTAIIDTSKNILSDTTRSLADTTRPSETTDVDTSIFYSATDSVVYSLKTRYMNMYGKGNLKYKTFGLDAERIAVNWDTAILTAEGAVDTSDKKGNKFIGKPILKDGGETYYGDRITYNFRTQKGRINIGTTELDNAFYRGERIKKIDPTTLFVEDGRFTTCSDTNPHFYFTSPKMKIFVRDHIVAEPIYLYIADVPVFMLPFGVFPNESGRRSGLIMPSYGNDARRGRYLTGFGYFWAMSDYMDLASTFDWYSRGGWMNHTTYEYVKRYDFNGAIGANISSMRAGEPGDPSYNESRSYNISVQHGQQIDPTMRLDVNFTFMSNDYFRNYSTDYNQILTQEVTSNATFSKVFESTNSSLILSVNRQQNLSTGDVSEILPYVTYSQSQIYPFRRSAKTRGLTGLGSSEFSWYEMIGFSYSGVGQHNRNLHNVPIQSLVYPYNDSITVEVLDERSGIRHSLSTGISPELGYFNLSPYISYTELWYNTSIRRDSNGTYEKQGFEAVRFFSTGVSLSTQFYGMFQPQVFGIKGIRHTVNPSISYSYQPDFSESGWGYYGTYKDKDGLVKKYSYFERELYGGAPQGRSQSIGFNIRNVFEMKYATSDTVEKDNKIQLLNANASFSYNLVADSMGLSPLYVSYQSSIGNIINISASTAYNFYAFDKNSGRRVNKLVWDTDRKIADLTNFNISVSTSLSGARSAPENKPAVSEESEGIYPAHQPIYQGLYGNFNEEPDFSIPWNLSLTWFYSQSQDNPLFIYRSSNLNGSVSFSLTPHWQFSAQTNYDLINKQFSAPSIGIDRDLHCWLLSFSWMPIGTYRGYKLEIRIKAPELSDLKVTKEGNARGIY